MSAKNRKGSPVLGRGRAKIVEIFGADLRSLAAFRIVLALLVLADLADRSSDLYAHYTDAGVLPRSALTQVLSRWVFSLNLANGEAFFQALLFGLAGLAALVLLIGYRTRLITFIVWVLLLSIQLRAQMMNNAGDALLHLLLFWGMFLPLGACWSVDQALKGAPSRLSMRFVSMATFGLFMQIAFVYWFTSLLKSNQTWRVDLTGIYYALSGDEFATQIGTYLYQFPKLLEVLTFATIWFETFGPFLLFFPFFTGPVRTVAVLAFMGFHFGIWLTMSIGFFPWISAFCMVCFLPSWFWDKALPKLHAAFPKRLSIARRLQRTAAPLLGNHWLAVRARLFPKTGVERASGAGSVAGGEQTSLSAPSGTNNGLTVLRSSFLTNALALFFLVYILFWNLTTVSTLQMPVGGVPIGKFLGLDQTWNMFDYPSDNGWYVIPGTLRGGQEVDLMGVTRGDFGLHKVSWEKPESVPSTYKNERWRKYMSRIRNKKYTNQRLYLGRYICREWNSRHTSDEQLTTFQISFMREKVLPDYQLSTPNKDVLWHHNCFS